MGETELATAESRLSLRATRVDMLLREKQKLCTQLCSAQQEVVGPPRAAAKCSVRKYQQVCARRVTGQLHRPRSWSGSKHAGQEYHPMPATMEGPPAGEEETAAAAAAAAAP